MVTKGGVRINSESAINFIDLDEIKVNPESVKAVSKDLAVRFSVFPFDTRGNCLYLAMSDPVNHEAMDVVRLISRGEILPFKAAEDQITHYIKLHYERVDAEKAVEILKQVAEISVKSESAKSSIYSSIENAPAVKLAETIINKGILINASDIHIEPYENEVLIRYRKDGALFKDFSIPFKTYGALNTRIKVLAAMDISGKRVPQDGKLQYKLGDRICDLRVSSLPTIYGEKFVIRILYKSSQYCDLKNINFSNQQMELINKMLNHTCGMILITGPTGSGKSTTLYAMLNELNSPDKNITTVEDPVEMPIKGINQVNVNNKSGLNFAAGLRSILRQDPDIIMIGEIRDSETADISVRAAITGHLVLSTLHTNSALASINRLSDMGVERYLLTDSLIAVLAQRLVRKICPDCVVRYDPTKENMEILGWDNPVYLSKGNGCSHCYGTGYSGRVAVCEILYMDDNIRQMILQGAGSSSIKEYLSKCGMKFLVNNCSELVASGITTYDEFLKISNGEAG